jgi:hypothetical protein
MALMIFQIKRSSIFKKGPSALQAALGRAVVKWRVSALVEGSRVEALFKQSPHPSRALRVVGGPVKSSATESRGLLEIESFAAKRAEYGAALKPIGAGHVADRGGDKLGVQSGRVDPKKLGKNAVKKSGA